MCAHASYLFRYEYLLCAFSIVMIFSIFTSCSSSSIREKTVKDLLTWRR
ncbi:MAG: hypothetical protein KC400_05840 [Methanolinea sp.]|nr:hypothetical protein [Methanolinea sp.]